MSSGQNLHAAQSHALLREWQCRGTTINSPGDFILPIFITQDENGVEEIASLPGVKRWGVNSVMDFLRPLVVELDLKSVLLFPVMSSSSKGLDKMVSEQSNPVIKAIPLLRNAFPDLVILTDVCICGFSDTGHCCVFDHKGKMDNGESLKHIANLALAYAQAGAHVIAPSDMMDGRIRAIRDILDENSFSDVSIMSYAAKFSSFFYGPFRDAAGSAPSFGDRRCYQLPMGSSGLAMRAVERDLQQGADIVMVKPGMAYLDVIKNMATKFPEVPISVYHVSGEYAMLWHGAQAGAFELNNALLEVITSFKRAGASIIITYYTPLLLKLIKGVE
ncbi:Delta-aminolevulinic acid dehydratase [Halotydeus destructor]|nr:Delta-aminolevulinic acid dehydratase [Halotydeus destructor]